MSTRLFWVSPGALTCFATAARGCMSAKLFIQQANNSLDAYFAFAIEPGGRPRCRVIELIQDQSGGLASNDFAACQMVSLTPGGVLLGCPGQRIVIPRHGVMAVPGRPSERFQTDHGASGRPRASQSDLRMRSKPGIVILGAA
jgi:hypothetical protein